MKTIAVTRGVSTSYINCSLEFNSREKIDIDLAREQHRKYCESLRAAGLEVLVLPALNNYPDACFVEDTAVVLQDSVLITNMGSEERNGEQQAVADCLQRWCRVSYMQPPATLEGGDVLGVDHRLLVGRSRRTNQAGIEVLERFAEPLGYTVCCLDVDKYLHLKTAITYAGNYMFVATAQMERNARPLLDAERDVVKVVPADCESAANVLAVNRKVLLPQGFPKVTKLLAEVGIDTEELDISEFRKGEAGLTCLSIVL